MDIEVKGLVRANTVPNYPDQEEGGPALNGRGDMLMAQALPELTELVRLGGSWQVLSAATAALTAVPTTTSGLTLWNGEADNGKVYAVDSFGCVEILADATQQNSLALFAAVEAGKMATTPTDAGLTKASLSGRPAGQTACRVAAAATVAGVWTPHGPSAPGATAFAGAVWRVHEFAARGLYLVRPGGGFSIAAAKSAATASQLRYFIRWHEVQLSYV